MSMYTLVQRLMFVFLLVVPLQTFAAETASQLFKTLKQQVYQIRIIDKASGNKSTIGSGFQISKDGYLATNFHVVSSFVHKPDKFSLEYVYHDGTTGNAELHDIDVVHDLAILKIKPLQDKYFTFNLKSLSKGERIFSMGNPHDLSMLIIEGNFSGLLKESRFKKILFSGSLNAGMSGGPAFDKTGKLIGINVSKGSEQISFLVPAARLDTLFKRAKKNGKVKDFNQVILSDLYRDQNHFYKKLLKKKWTSESLGLVEISGKLDKSFKCWGHTVDDEDILYEGVHKHCRSQDRLYISQDMHTGMFSYDYEWITSKKLNRFQFYTKVENRFTHGSFNNVRKKENVTNYSCEEKFVSLTGHSWKISSCIRAYKKYKGLYDVLLLLTSVDKNDKTLLAKAAMSGVSKENSTDFIKSFLGRIKWKN